MALVRRHDAGLKLPPRLRGFRALDRDRLAMTPRNEVAKAANLALYQMQDIMDPEVQVLGAAVLFATYCRRCNLDPADVHGIALRVLDAPDEGDTPTGNALQVLRDFIGARVLNKEVTIG